MNHNYSAVFKKLGIITLEEFRSNVIDFFENGQKYNIIITELDSLSEEEVYNHLNDYSSAAMIPCHNKEQFETAYRSFERMFNIGGGVSTYFLIEPVAEKQNKQQGYFFNNLTMPVFAISNIFTDTDKIFINSIKDFKRNPKENFKLYDFLIELEERVKEEFKNRAKGYDNLLDANWLLGNGAFIPDNLISFEDEQREQLFELVIYCNIIAVNHFLLPSELKKIKVTQDELHVLIKYLNCILDLNFKYSISNLKIGTLTEYEILSEGYYFIEKLDSDEVDEIFNERDYKIYLMRVEEGKYLPETIREIHDSYNNGWVYDLRDIIENLSDFIDTSGVQFLARLSK
ncbi:hypothetical protein [Acinetobacter beijerinckii]|uniref:Uncharacterized protein n=2 Tax=Acinetobacter beijerinckii TaxID=262668 RepID=N9DYB8_9GAMM|nr:hypothetical protein [Acinetobacter beijerinckii]ENW02927.1 hypothetical protein F933_03333 [Acinetobacter beijerinckii CIP 110307]